MQIPLALADEELLRWNTAERKTVTTTTTTTTERALSRKKPGCSVKTSLENGCSSTKKKAKKKKKSRGKVVPRRLLFIGTKFHSGEVVGSTFARTRDVCTKHKRPQIPDPHSTTTRKRKTPPQSGLLPFPCEMYDASCLPADCVLSA